MTVDEMILEALLLGVGATLVLDLWGLVLRKGFNIPSLDMRMVGRWLGGFTRGQFYHVHIGKAAPFPFEGVIGWGAHFLIGCLFAATFLMVVGRDWLQGASFLPALLFGMGTVVFPFFLMQPAFGFGVAASKTPSPYTARLKSIISHCVFGVGLYLTGAVISTLGMSF